MIFVTTIHIVRTRTTLLLELLSVLTAVVVAIHIKTFRYSVNEMKIAKDFHLRVSFTHMSKYIGLSIELLRQSQLLRRRGGLESQKF